MRKIGIIMFLCAGVFVVIVFSINQWGFSSSTDKYDFYRRYNDTLSFHVKGKIYDVGMTDVMYDRSFTLIKNKKDSLSIPLTATEFLSVHIKFDTIYYRGSNHIVMFIKNFGNPDGKIIDIAKMKILANSIDDSIVFDSTHLFLDKYSVELKRDL